ncbi:MAG TPA: barstar family protein [Candidatus Acidoferrales bacterium]|nr:barstar family protein [Candidatus Acidoferrales bacterium]
MREIVLDGSRWISSKDVYDSFLTAVGAPNWHGHNFNALRDSIGVGGINSIEVPYKVRIKNFSLIGAGAKRMADGFAQLIGELRDSGCPVDIQIDD